MKQLKKQFTGIGEVRGFEFSQICVTSKGFVYKVDSFGTIYYEVFRKRLNSRFGTISYPSSKSFGKWAWTIRNKEEAIKRLNEL